MTLTISTDKIIKYLQILLLIIITVLLIWSRPWNTTSSTSDIRKITVNGDATIKAEPNQYLFSPYFEKSGTDKDEIKEELNTDANIAVNKIKELGVEEKDIRLDSSSFDFWYINESENDEGSLTISLQITVYDKQKAQEVQDYLQTLDLKGQLTPQATFSQDKQKELDTQAVEKATEDAKQKAEAQAKQLGVKLGKVITVDQGIQSGYPIANYQSGISELSVDSASAAQSLPVLSGQNEYNKSITITYELK